MTRQISRRGALAGGFAALSAGCLGRTRNIAGRDRSSQLTLEINAPPADRDPNAIRIARHLAENLNAVGIDARISTSGTPTSGGRCSSTTTSTCTSGSSGRRSRSTRTRCTRSLTPVRRGVGVAEPVRIHRHQRRRRVARDPAPSGRRRTTRGRGGAPANPR